MVSSLVTPSRAKQVGSRALEFDFQLVSEDRASSQDREIPKDGLAIIPEPRSLDSHNPQLPTQLVQNRSRQHLPINILSNNNQQPQAKAIYPAKEISPPRSAR